jgi:hypothetical protein
MKLIPLTKGHFAQVDDCNFDWLSQWKWYAQVSGKNVYAVRNINDSTIQRAGRKRKTLGMHRVILNVIDKKILVDHRDGNGLNNQEANIRTCVHRQNTMNRGSKSGSVSAYKGVYFKKDNKIWAASISVDGKSKHIGYFECEIEAARHYNYWAKRYNGEFARYNDVSPMFPDATQ